MGDLTPHFSAHEFRCRDGSEHTIDCRLLAMLEAIRCQFGPVSVTSGYRSPAYNQAVGGAANSLHLTGQAADILANETPYNIYAWADKNFPISGLGLYERAGGGWVHVDCRGYRARWSG